MMLKLVQTLRATNWVSSHILALTGQMGTSPNVIGAAKAKPVIFRYNISYLSLTWSEAAWDAVDVIPEPL